MFKNKKQTLPKENVLIEQAAYSYESFRESFKIQIRSKKFKIKIWDSIYSVDHTFEQLHV